MTSLWTGTVADVRGSWVRPASVRGLFAVPLIVAIVLGITSVGAAPVLAHSVPSAAAGPPGTGLAWGTNNAGRLGDGTTTDSSNPVAVDVPAGTTITAVAAGQGHSLAVTSAGTALAWGANAFGQLGDGTTIPSSSTPVAVDVPAGTTVTALSGGGVHNLAVTSAGTALAWGDNFWGQLGDGSTTRSRTPVAVNVPAGTTITAVAAGQGHSLAVTSAGTALAWGDNSSGQLGDGTATDSSIPVAVDVPAGTTVTAVAAGGLHSLALTSGGDVLAWGANGSGQLGDGTTTSSSTPVAVDVPAGTTITAVAAGDRHSLAVTSTGTVLAWGDNTAGQLGDGSTTSSSTPVAVNVPAGTTITAVAAGQGHSLAVTSTGTALAWGANTFGQLGDGSTTSSSIPVAVDLPAGTTVTAIAGGSFHSLAIVPSTSTTTLQVSPPNPTPNQDVTLTATVTCTTDTPTGTITFRNNNTDLTTVALDSNNTATHTTRLPPGTHTLTAHHTSTNTCPSNQSESTTITITAPDDPDAPDTPNDPDAPDDPDDPDLPITGPNLPTTIGTATLLILTGAALVHLTRRHRPTHHPN
ncbi:RCC1 domain-containing protein [Salinispora arenicola]|uniref:RCC1 domain-containing protein n=1 Tax=Salinispora arenicola TaxID=168697 RepID=UPI000478404C|nr:RCC1 domain-containing protein [Salinispora arenicola]